MFATVKTKAIVAHNLRALLDSKDMSEHQLAGLTKVAQKTINNLLNQKSAPTIRTLEKLASGFRLNCWHLLLPNLDPAIAPDLEQLIDSFSHSTGDGRAYIQRVAEKESGYVDGGE